MRRISVHWVQHCTEFLLCSADQKLLRSCRRGTFRLDWKKWKRIFLSLGERSSNVLLEHFKEDPSNCSDPSFIARLMQSPLKDWEVKRSYPFRGIFSNKIRSLHFILFPSVFLSSILLLIKFYVFEFKHLCFTLKWNYYGSLQFSYINNFSSTEMEKFWSIFLAALV